MIDEERLVAFLGAAVLVTLAPGPDILYVLTRGMTQGRRIALAAAAGFALGNIVHTLLAALGLSALLASSPTAFRCLKYAGAAYLVYLGVKMWRDKQSLMGDSAGDRASQASLQVFRQSIIANMLNPKVAVFFLSFLPQFVDPSRGDATLQFLLLGAVFIVQCLACFSAVALASGWLGEQLTHRAGVGKALRIIAGAVLIALGVHLAVAS